MMDGVGKMNIVWAARNQITDLVQHPLCAAMPIGTMAALWTRLSPIVATTLDDLRFGQIFDACDALRGIRQVLSRPWHDKALLGNVLQAHNLALSSRCVIIKTQ
jgi:hypothetical protein